MAGPDNVTHPYDRRCPFCIEKDAEDMKRRSQKPKPATKSIIEGSKRPLFVDDSREWRPDNAKGS